MGYELSIILPARAEEFLAGTIERLLQNTSEKTEIIAVLDGEWANPPIAQHPRVNIVYVPQSIGQRKATNLGARLSNANYIAKMDAHCVVDEGFDTKMISFMEKHGDNVTAVPIMKNLWMFDWKCYHCGWKKYQGPKPEACGGCGKGDKIRRKMMWYAKPRPKSWSFCFDSTPHFQYFEDYKHRPGIRERAGTEGWSESMSIQGSFFMATREKYWELELSGEELGSWGNQGIEVACKTWLSGGRVLINHETWYAHLFRTQPQFGFPYRLPESEAQATKNRVWKEILGGKIPGQKYKVSWLVEKFSPIPGWDEKAIAELKKLEK